MKKLNVYSVKRLEPTRAMSETLMEFSNLKEAKEEIKQDAEMRYFLRPEMPKIGWRVRVATLQREDGNSGIYALVHDGAPGETLKPVWVKVNP